MLKSPYYLDKLNRVAKVLANKSGNLLDIGFGMGHLERILTEQKSKLNLFGIDFAPKSVSRVKKLYKGRFLTGKVQKIPFEKSLFDYVAMLDVLEHIPEAESKKVLDEINRVMKKGGTFIITVPVNEDLEKMNREGINLNHHLRAYNYKILKSELKRSGIGIIKVSYIYAFPTLYKLKTYIANLIPGIRKPSVMLVIAKKK